jgi:hypothetical protein
VTPASALLLAHWVSVNHPAIFNALYKQAQKAQLGDDSVDLSPVTVDTSGIDFSNIDYGTATDSSSATDLLGINTDPQLTDISLPASLSPDNAASVLGIPQINTPVSSSPSVTSQIASGVGSVVSAVGSFLASPGGAQSLVNLAKAIATTNTPVINTQVSRAVSGLAPAPISYVTNPYTGALTPVLNTPYGTANVNGQVLSALSGSGLSQFVSQYGLYLAAGLLLVMLAA